MPKQALESLTESMFYLLMALTQGERCGTEITAFAAEITAGRVKIGPATLYTLLGKFEKEGLIAETSVLGCKRYYQITPAGRAAYTAECTRLQLCLQNAAAAARMGCVVQHNFPETAADAARRNRFPCRSLKRSAKADLLHRVNQPKPAKPAEFLYFFSIQNTKQTAPPPCLAAWGGGALLL